MDKNSTHLPLMQVAERGARAAELTPSEVTLEFIRRFARVYTSYPCSSGYVGFVLN